MKKISVISLFVAIVFIAACGPGQSVKEDAPPAGAASSSAEAKEAPVVVVDAEASKEKAIATAKVMEARAAEETARLKKEQDASKKALDDTVAEFWKKVGAGDVMSASALIAADARDAEKRELFILLDKHNINRFRVDGVKYDFEAAAYSAEIAGTLLLSGKTSVETSKKSIIQRWKYVDSKWLMVGSD